MLVEEVEDHVAAATDIGGVHGELAEEVAHVGHDDGECAQSVPEVVEGEEALRAHAGALVGQRDERAAQLDGVGGVLFEELV